MSKYTKTTLILFILAALFWMMCIIAEPANLELIFALVAVFCSIGFLCLMAVSISQRMNKNLSPYRVFALVDALIGLGVVLYAVYDILTDTGFWAGITGIVLLVTVLPMTLLLLLADFLAFHISQNRKK